MHVRVINFGSNWWGMHSRALDDPLCFQTECGLVQLRSPSLWPSPPVFRCLPRSDSLQLDQRFQSGVSLARSGQNVSLLGTEPIWRKGTPSIRSIGSGSGAGCLAGDVEFRRSRRDRVHKTWLAIGRSAADLDQFTRRKIRSNAALWLHRLGPERPGTMDNQRRWAASCAR